MNRRQLSTGWSPQHSAQFLTGSTWMAAVINGSPFSDFRCGFRAVIFLAERLIQVWFNRKRGTPLRPFVKSCSNILQAFKVSGCSFLLVIKRRAWKPLKFASTQVCFGLTCSPFLAMSVTRYHALKHLQGFPLGANQVLENMYVDDIVFSVDENEEAIETVRQLMVLMKKGRFHLTKWVSNMKAVLADLLTEDIMGKNTMTSKTLGIVWDSANVELAYSVLSEVDPSSRDRKRQLISVIAKLYDPLGHLSSYIIKVMAKEMMINWDDKLPSDLQKGWQTWKLELCDISDI
ncbi:hypothetical protein T02_9994 [Trichinella nativa]|uniref:Reverse transcriptase domain-containing protein n=1 Tax=Trichinella nativa TaxID=6335 RepID=A0A0V1LIM3_9BILA|nr:hypothetical protein T02_9994 [Trichinella nativa]